MLPSSHSSPSSTMPSPQTPMCSVDSPPVVSSPVLDDPSLVLGAPVVSSLGGSVVTCGMLVCDPNDVSSRSLSPPEHAAPETPRNPATTQPPPNRASEAMASGLANPQPPSTFSRGPPAAS
jgi:hypothetical protein